MHHLDAARPPGPHAHPMRAPFQPHAPPPRAAAAAAGPAGLWSSPSPPALASAPHGALTGVGRAAAQGAPAMAGAGAPPRPRYQAFTPSPSPPPPPPQQQHQQGAREWTAGGPGISPQGATPSPAAAAAQGPMRGPAGAAPSFHTLPPPHLPGPYGVALPSGSRPLPGPAAPAAHRDEPAAPGSQWRADALALAPLRQHAHRDPSPPLAAAPQPTNAGAADASGGVGVARDTVITRTTMQQGGGGGAGAVARVTQHLVVREVVAPAGDAGQLPHSQRLEGMPGTHAGRGQAEGRAGAPAGSDGSGAVAQRGTPGMPPPPQHVHLGESCVPPALFPRGDELLCSYRRLAALRAAVHKRETVGIPCVAACVVRCSRGERARDARDPGRRAASGGRRAAGRRGRASRAPRVHTRRTRPRRKRGADPCFGRCGSGNGRGAPGRTLRAAAPRACATHARAAAAGPRAAATPAA